MCRFKYVSRLELASQDSYLFGVNAINHVYRSIHNCVKEVNSKVKRIQLFSLPLKCSLSIGGIHHKISMTKI